MEEFGFPESFPKKVEQEVSKMDLSIGKKEISKRRDFRSITTITIDPDDAKDFDDALSIEEKKDGLLEIGVHIADVSHYVKPGTLLDQEAFKRAKKSEVTYVISIKTHSYQWLEGSAYWESPTLEIPNTKENEEALNMHKEGKAKQRQGV